MSEMIAYEGLNPDGENDYMCKIVVDSQSVLRLTDCIPSSGEFTLKFWIKKDGTGDVQVKANEFTRIAVIYQNWSRFEFTFETNRAGSVEFELDKGTYYLYHVKLEKGNTASEWSPYPVELEDLKLYKIDDKFKDSVRCGNDGLWYIEREVSILKYDGSENWLLRDGAFVRPESVEYERLGLLPAKCTHFKNGGLELNEGEFHVSAEDFLYVRIKANFETVAEFKTWLSANNIEILMPLPSPNRYILDERLQSFLNSIPIKKIEIPSNKVEGMILQKPIVFGEVVGESIIVNNQSDVEDIGFRIQIGFNGEVVNPSIYIYESDSYMKLNYTFEAGESVTIDTRSNLKSIIKEKNGTFENLINSLVPSSTWLKIKPGNNRILQTADSGVENMESVIFYTNEFEGV